MKSFRISNTDAPMIGKMAFFSYLSFLGILISEIKVERTLASMIRQHERTRTPAEWKSFPSEVDAINKIFIQRFSTFAQMTAAIAGFHMGAVEASSN